MCALLVQPNTFQVEVTEPLDSRLQVADQTERDGLPFKWQGMQVFVIADQVTYVLTTMGPDQWDPIGSGVSVQDEGTPLPVRSAINFTGGVVTASDDAGNNRTNVTIDITTIDGGVEP